MLIGIDFREALGKRAGKGYYAYHLVSEILKQDKENQYVLYTSKPVHEFESHPNVLVKIITKKSFLWHLAVLKHSYKENVQVFFSPTSYIIPALHNPQKIKVVMTVHDLVAFLFPEIHNKKALFTERVFLKKALGKASRVFAVSLNTKRDLITQFFIPNELVSIVHNAASNNFKVMPHEELKDFKRKNNLPEKFIFAAGTLEPRKNFTMLIRCFAQILKEFPDYKLIIAGSKGWYYDEIFTTAEELKLEDKVKFLGYVTEEELIKLYNLAEIFVYPSLYEGFGIPPLEAMKCGCPVITSNTSSLPEVAGDAAIKINPKKEKELTEAITKLLKNSDLKKELTRRGLEQCQKFSWEKSAQEAVKLFNKLDESSETV
ncbi:glycosyltransferase family 4 protein [Candidatus Peregrinibacteria bacterium]|nr:glycosyltransferase family 4 protein [Candidatus Peregrinibacteria bacterium]